MSALEKVPDSALLRGDIETIEKWVGPPEERLQSWLKDRLKKENLGIGQVSAES